MHVIQQNAGQAPLTPQRKPRTQWRDGKALSYKTKKEAQDQIDFVRSLGMSDLLKLDSAIAVDPAGAVQ